MGHERLCRWLRFPRKANAFLLTTVTHFSGTTLMLVLALRFSLDISGETKSAVGSGRGPLRRLRAGNFLSRAVEGKHGPYRARGCRSWAPPSPPYSRFFTQGYAGSCIGRRVRSCRRWHLAYLAVRGFRGRPKGIGSALLAGLGFAAYFLCIKQAGEGSVFWLAAVSRFVSFFVTGAIVVLTRQYKPMDLTGVGWGSERACSTARNRYVHSCQPGWAARYGGGDQLTLPWRHRAPGAHLPGRTVFALAVCRAGGRAAGRSHDRLGHCALKISGSPLEHRHGTATIASCLSYKSKI